MAVQVFADDILLYDIRLPETALLDLKITTGVNKGGSATFTMSPNHPLYNGLVSFRTVITIYKNNKLKFRGRVLQISDDFYRCRTVTCEGERCFLHDAVHKPYLYQDSPANIFNEVINLYNSQVEEFKQFVIGTVSVTDANNYIRLESNTAEQISDTVNKLVDRCGGYITFTTNSDGLRAINWLSELTHYSSQSIEFGKNLIDFTKTVGNTDIVTRIIPFGALLDENGNRVTIESVNDGLDFIQDDEAVLLRGIIAKAFYWDDVTEPINLLHKAEETLYSNKNIITTLKLTAVDLSNSDKNIDDFQTGDNINVLCKPHNIDEVFLLTEKTEDLLNPDASTITLGKDKKSLTGLDVAGDYKSQSELKKVERQIRSDYTLNTAVEVEEAKQTLTSLIQQTSEAIKLEISDIYATNENVESIVSTQFTQFSESFEFLFKNLQAIVDENDENTKEQFALYEKYIRFVDGNIILGENGNELTLNLANDRIKFLDSGAEVAYFAHKKLYVLDGEFLNSLRIGSFALVPRQNGNLSLVKVGD